MNKPALKYQIPILFLLAITFLAVMSSTRETHRDAQRFHDAIRGEVTFWDVLQWPAYWDRAVAYPGAEHKIDHVVLHTRTVIFAAAEESFDTQENFAAALRKYMEESKISWSLTFHFERPLGSYMVRFKVNPDGRIEDVTMR